MDKHTIIQFFDRCAPTWDNNMITDDVIINTILDNAKISEGVDVLDVACGTGIMFPYYLQRKVNSVWGIDISPNMAELAAKKYEADPKIHVICGDVEDTQFPQKFDRIVIYNAFPHFLCPISLVQTLTGLLNEGGRLTIAHGASREAINAHHQGTASDISYELMPADSLLQLFLPYFDVDVVISNHQMYQISGTLRAIPSV